MKSKLLLLLCFFSIHKLTDAQSAQKPNIIIIIADDLGYGDVSCYNTGRIQTPHIDQLAKKGIRFTNAHTT